MARTLSKSTYDCPVCGNTVQPAIWADGSPVCPACSAIAWQRDTSHDAPPKGITLSNEAARFTLRIRHSPGCAVAFLIAFTLFWNGFLVVWMSIAFASRAYFMMVFGIPHALAGLAMIYFTLIALFNSIRISVDATRLEVRHEPLPWFGNATLNPVDLRAIHAQRIERRTKNGVQINFNIMATLNDKKSAPVVKSLSEASHAQYISQFLARRLTLEPVVLPDERE